MHKSRFKSKHWLSLCAASSLMAVEVKAQVVADGDTIIHTNEVSELGDSAMPDAAMRGAGCLALAAPIMATAYAVGPTEIMLLVTGAVIVPSSSAQLLITLGGILGGAACGIGATITPNVMWAKDAMVESFQTASAPYKSAAGELKPVAMVEEPEFVDESMIQGAGCLAGILGLSAITFLSAPVEIVGLAAGGVTVPSTSASLFLGIAGTVMPAGCTIGAAAALPLLALSRTLNLNAIGDAMAAFWGWGQDKPLNRNSFLYIEANQSLLNKGALSNSEMANVAVTKTSGI